MDEFKDAVTPAQAGQLEPGNRQETGPKGIDMAMMNDEMDKAAQDQYNAAFEEGAPAPVEQSEDEAFGITPPEEAIAAAEAGEAPGTDGPGDEAAEMPAPAPTTTDELNQNSAGDEESLEMPVDPKEAQRIKSWEGRLKKMEADLKAKAPHVESAAAEALEDVGEQAEDAGNEALGDAAEKLSEQVESGALSVSQAMKQLTEDFGEDFVRMIEAIASAKAGEVGNQAVSSVKGEVESIVGHIKDSAEKAHFKTIMSVHPDFNDVRQDPAFAAFAQANPELQRVADGGTAEEVIKLIQDYKASTAAPAAPAAKTTSEQEPGDAGQSDPEGVDAAAGVRSGGLRLPAEPADTSDYEGAWDEASKMKS
jgi:hypothetical protein